MAKDNVRKQVLNAADKAVNGSRDKQYGQPEDNFLRIARLWNSHGINSGLIDPTDASKQFTPEDVAIMLSLVKIGRLANSPDHLDTWVDIAGYAACGAEVADAK